MLIQQYIMIIYGRPQSIIQSPSWLLHMHVDVFSIVTTVYVFEIKFI